MTKQNSFMSKQTDGIRFNNLVKDILGSNVHVHKTTGSKNS